MIIVICSQIDGLPLETLFVNSSFGKIKYEPASTETNASRQNVTSTFSVRVRNKSAVLMSLKSIPCPLGKSYNATIFFKCSSKSPARCGKL